MNTPLGHPENRITAFVGRHPRECGAVLTLAGGAIVWWQAVRPILLADEAASFTLSPALAALGFLVTATGLAYLVGGHGIYRALVLEKTEAVRRRLRWAGYALGVATAAFYMLLAEYLKNHGYTVG